MEAHVHEWCHLLLRWFHVLAGIMWIGDSFLFMWLDRTLTVPSPPRDGVTGELFMVHGGGYYQLERRQFQPGRMPPLLHWFKWEATMTGASGFLLLVVVYYLGGGILLVDRTISDIPVAAAVALGIALLPASWLLYDVLWKSPLGKSTAAAGAVSFALLGALAYGLTRVFSARAAFMHVGAVLGTIMVMNVWVRILPAQRRMLAAVKRGEAVDPAPGLEAKKRSTQNSYMTLPVLFVMISNHFPGTYGSRFSWAILLLLVLAGAAVRHFMLLRSQRAAWVLGAAAAAVAAAFVLTGPEAMHAAEEANETKEEAAAAARPLLPIDPATVGTIRGVVRFDGAAPARAPLSMTADCASSHKGAEPALTNRTLVKDGLLENAIVYISGGADGFQVPAPAGEVSIDQRGCVYHPRVIAARTGQTIAILNSDPILHNVHAVAQKNDGFNLSMPTQGGRATKTFRKPEIVQMKCDVHPWMGARIGVFAHPWFAVTDARGAFSLDGVPPGDYVVTAWHEELGEKTAKVTVAPKATADAAFAFAAR